MKLSRRAFLKSAPVAAAALPAAARATALELADASTEAALSVADMARDSHVHQIEGRLEASDDNLPSMSEALAPDVARCGGLPEWRKREHKQACRQINSISLDLLPLVSIPTARKLDMTRQRFYKRLVKRDLGRDPLSELMEQQAREFYERLYGRGMD